MPVLYRKYRPQTFADVVGQAHVTRTLAAAIAGGRLAHAYLFVGPRGIGKTTTARLLAKAVNCERRSANDARSHPERPRAKRGGVDGPLARSTRDAPQGEPCRTCPTCVEITEGRCLDVIEIDAASHTQVEKVREQIIETVRIAPTRARRRVFIIDEVHMLSSASFNALLKTLEEPPAHVLFILATTELHKVPETVRSRCQQFTFRRVAPADIERRLAALVEAEGATVDRGVLAAIARAADGSLRDAESMLGQLLAIGGDRVTADDAAFILPRSNAARARALLDAVAAGDPRAALTELRAAEEEGVDADAFGRDAVSLLRDDLHRALDVGQSPERTIVALRALTGLLDALGRSEHPFLLLEAMVLGLIVESGIRNQESGIPTVVTEDQRRLAMAVPSMPPTSDPNRYTVATEASAGDTDSVLANVRTAWGTLGQRLGDRNHALPYLLEGGRPQRVAGDLLTIAFRYKLHAEKVRDPKVAGILAEAITAATGHALRIATVVTTAKEFAELNALTRPKTGDALVDAALEVFGGKVVP